MAPVTDAEQAVGEVGIWLMLSTLLLGVALASVYLGMISAEYEFLSGWLVTFGYQEFALITATSAVLSFIQTYRLYTIER